MPTWPHPESKSAALFERARRVLPGGISRGQTWIDPFPIYVREASGAEVTDVDGVTRIDFLNNFASLIHGHSHPEVVRAVAEALPRGSVYSMPNAVELDLAELLCERIASVEQVRFCNSGTEAVMLALKAARARTGRPRIAKVEGSYHGMYDYAEISLDASPANWGNRPTPVPFAHGTPSGVLADTVIIPFNDVETAEAMLREAGDSLAAILVDPAPAQVGMMPMSPAFAAMVRKVADDIGAVLVCDEVIALRIGYHGGQARVGLRPDLTTMAKIIGGGYPVGAIGGTREAMAVFSHEHGKPLNPTSGTFTSNPISMTAGLVTMRLLDEAAYDRLEAIGNRARAALGEVMRATGFPGQVTGMASMLHLHAHERTITDHRSAYHQPEEAARLRRIYRGLTDAGCMISPRGACFLSTVNTDAHIERLAAGLRGCIERMD
ncbi:MAG: aspartate aminotransferase family protein [Ectothiorhodospiraceae bacterium]|nr:aspartate aminotransferase family protein [Ectothiorhodospiraceae bacterium]